jgi:lipoyl-dependent peroxiredoxin
MKRSAYAKWQGTGKEGSGSISTDSDTLNEVPYSYLSRFENDPGTNPEELIAAAHAGCFSMKLSFNLTQAGFPPDQLFTNCEITMEDGKISQSHLRIEAKIHSIQPDVFQELVEDARKNCPVSKLLNTNITCDATMTR